MCSEAAVAKEHLVGPGSQQWLRAIMLRCRVTVSCYYITLRMSQGAVVWAQDMNACTSCWQCSPGGGWYNCWQLAA